MELQLAILKTFESIASKLIGSQEQNVDTCKMCNVDSRLLSKINYLTERMAQIEVQLRALENNMWKNDIVDWHQKETVVIDDKSTDVDLEHIGQDAIPLEEDEPDIA